jgi:hypothetical protein
VAKNGVQVARIGDEAEAVEKANAGGFADELKRLGQELVAYAEDEGKAADKLKELDNLLSTLTAAELMKLADHPVMQLLDRIQEKQFAASGNGPGTIRYLKGIAWDKKPWTWQDLARSGMEQITFTPMETKPVIWNGLRVDFQARKPITVFKCFYDIYMQSIDAQDFAEAHANFLFKQGGATHPDMITPEAARVRGTGSKGAYLPGAGTAGITEPIAAAPGEGAGGKNG